MATSQLPRFCYQPGSGESGHSGPLMQLIWRVKPYLDPLSLKLKLAESLDSAPSTTASGSSYWASVGGEFWAEAVEKGIPANRIKFAFFYLFGTPGDVLMLVEPET